MINIQFIMFQFKMLTYSLDISILISCSLQAVVKKKKKSKVCLVWIESLCRGLRILSVESQKGINSV